MKLMRFLLFGALLQFTSSVVFAEMPAKLKLAKAEWCPYTCKNEAELPGIIHEYVTHILNAKGIEVEIKAYPWARALRLASRGDAVQGLLTAVHLEAPNLLLTNVPTAHFQNCFFALKSEKWEYSAPNSLQSMPKPLGIIEGYSYGQPMDRFIADHMGSDRIQNMTGVDGTARLAKMLSRERLRVVIEERNVYGWHLKNNPTDAEFVHAKGCLRAEPFYLAINPQYSWSAELIIFLNNAFADPENQKFLKSLEEKYLKRHS